jgi:PKD domain.
LHACRSTLEDPLTAEVPLGLIPGANGTFTFEVSGIQSFDPTAYIYMEDKVTGQWQDLRNNNTYTFTMNNNESVDRFVLHFTPKAEIATVNATCSENGQISITQPGQAQWIYTATNSSGVQVGSGLLNETHPVTLSVPKGVYTLTLTDANGYSVVKNIVVEGAQPIAAAFSSSQQVAEVEEPITFINTTADAANSTWNMGDGTIINTNNSIITHQYAAEGVYTVSLKLAMPMAAPM